MRFGWLKRYVPRSLFGRAALILLVPILTIQVVVSYVFIQRLYENVTIQMTQSVLADVALLAAFSRRTRAAGPWRALGSFELFVFLYVTLLPASLLARPRQTWKGRRL